MALEERLLDAVQRGDVDELRQIGAPAVVDAGLDLVLDAVWWRQLHVVVWLVEESERTGMDMAGGWRLIHAAGLLGDMDTVKAASQDDLKLVTGHGNTLLEVAVMGDQAEVIEYLLKERAAGVREQGVLDVASKYGCVAAINALAECGVQPDELSTALWQAAACGRVAAMERLVELGADVGAGNLDGGVLHAASGLGRVDAVDCAVRLGAGPCAVDVRGASALHAAVENEQLTVMAQLVQGGVPLDGADCYGRTALHEAVGLPEASRTLLELGADRWIKDRKGNTARDVAVARGRQVTRGGQGAEVVRLLDTYFPIVPSMMLLLLGLRRPSESPLARFGAGELFELRVLSLVNCLLVGKDDNAFAQLVEECGVAGAG